MNKIILIASLMPGVLCGSELCLKDYLQEQIDEISKEMSYMTVDENYITENRWIFLEGRINAYYDILYRFANND